MESAAQNRPRSCEVPGINICLSEQNTNEAANTSAPIPISNNTGSLPDLTNLYIPSPLPTPLDPEDQTYNHGSPHGGSTGNLSSSMPAQTLGIITTTNHMAGVVSPTQHSPQISPQISPQLQRRTVSNPGSPIAGAAADQRRQQFSPQLQKRARSSPSSPIAMTSNQWHQQHSPQPVGMDTTTIDHQQTGQRQQIMKVNMFQYQVQPQQQQQQQQQAQQQTQQQQQQQQQALQQPQRQQQNHRPTPAALDMTKVNVAVIQQQQQYRDNHQSLVNTSCASPTSPASNRSYSPVASPGVLVGSPGSPAYSDTYYLQLQQDTNALQQQFQEINMMQGDTASAQAPGIQYHQAYLPYVLEGQDSQGQPNKPSPAYPNFPLLTTQAQNPATIGIPDIIFTGVGESSPRQGDLPKEISSAISGVNHVDSFNSDAVFPGEIKLDPLDIDSLHMLTDNDMVADQATEESFRLDRL